jgi:cytochrome c2
MSDKTKNFIEKATNIHGNKYDYSKINYISCKNKITIICKEHGEFEQTPDCHINGKQGCKKCNNINRFDKQKLTQIQFLEKSVKKHGDKYDYSKAIYNGYYDKVTITCKIHGDFLQKPSDHFNGNGCKLCGKEITKIKMENRNNILTFTEKAREIHGNTYDYSKIDYVNSIKKVIIICKIHGDFLQDKTSHLQGCGCPKCGGSYKKDTQDFIIEAQKIHSDKYDYSKVNYTTCFEEIIIICKEHGQFLQKPYVHLTGRGCNTCGICKRADSCRDTKEIFIEKAKKIHGDEYNYSKIEYKISSIKVIIICKKHGEFLQAPNHHINGTGCPLCQKKKQYSKQQICWLNFMSKIYNSKIKHAKNGGEFIIPNTKFKADGYCKETNTVFEFHGDYWHGNPNKFKSNEYNKTCKYSFSELYQKTLKREQEIRDAGFNLIRIWESDWIKLNKSIRILQRKFRSSKLL